MERKDAKKMLETSKARLASAFNKLESILESNLSLNKSQKLELSILEDKTTNLLQENNRLSSDYANLELDYNQIKSLNSEIICEIDSSIKMIEDILGLRNGNS